MSTFAIFSGPAGTAFKSGAGHVYYGLIIAMGVTLLAIVGIIRPVWLLVTLIIEGMVFADLYAHGYAH